MVKAVILGCTGYTGVELIRILATHPEMVVSSGASRQWAGRRASEAFPFFRGHCDFLISDMEDVLREPQADVAFLALPHGESASAIRPLLDAGVRVVDLSADCRLRDPDVYSEWYGPHKDPGIVDQAVYGLPEIHRDKIRDAQLVANPGCYPTSVILGLAPIMARQDLDTSNVIVDSKSGISGAGRAAKLITSFCESGESVKPYSVLRHRHIPEMEQELSGLTGRPVSVRFTPHLMPMSRGMVSTMYLRLKEDVTAESLREDYERRYGNEPFVAVLPDGHFPDTAHVRGSNMCQVAVTVDSRSGWAIVGSALDNLVKGASGLAVQNMNLMMGMPETAALDTLPVFP